MWPVGIFFGVAFLIFAAIAWNQISSIRAHEVKSVFDLAFILFQGFWVLGWSVGVVILGALTALFFFYGETAVIVGERLIHALRLGPLRLQSEYDLAKIRNPRLERAGRHPRETVRIRFDYGDGASALGDAMERAQAERTLALIRDAAALLSGGEADKVAEQREPEPPPARTPVRAKPTPAREGPPPPLTSPSALALIGANIVPLGGVIFFHWNLGDIMVLFWAESAVIGFWNLIKLAIVGKWAVLLVGPFFAGHFGGFMAGHFLFIYYFFVRGIDASGPEPDVWVALPDLFVPLWPALAALFISHGVSFFTNYIGRREYVGVEVKTQMAEPYKRIIVMHLTIIFGGMLTMIFRTPTAALFLLIALKTAADLYAHRKEHSR